MDVLQSGVGCACSGVNRRGASRPIGVETPRRMTRGWDARKSPAEADSTSCAAAALSSRTNATLMSAFLEERRYRTQPRSCDREAPLGASLRPCCPAPRASPGSSRARSPAAGGSVIPSAHRAKAGPPYEPAAVFSFDNARIFTRTLAGLGADLHVELAAGIPARTQLLGSIH